MSTRRNFLKKSLFLAGSSLLPFRRLEAQSSDQVPISVQFPLGVASADVTSDSVILWTYYEGFYPIRAHLWSEEEEPNWQEAERQDGGFIHLDVQNLDAYKRYSYCFFEVSFSGKLVARSIIGSFKTAPPENELISIKFGVVSCVKYLYEPVILEHAAAREDLDFFMHNGDNSYNDGMNNLAEFRGRWFKTLSKKGSLRLRASTSLLATIDDHEIEDNFDPKELLKKNPEKLKAGLRAFFEHMPMRRNLEKPDQIWRKLSWGKTLDVFVLDCRTERNRSHKEYLSRAQMDWLKKGLRESEALFKVIMNSVPISEFPFPMAEDRWEGYPEQRREILKHIDVQGTQNLLWVSGDFHFTSLGRVSSSEPGSTQLEVLAGPGAQIPNPAGAILYASSRFDWIHLKNSYITVVCDVVKQRIEIVPVLWNG